MQPQPYPPPPTEEDMGVYGIAVFSFFQALFWYHLALQYAVLYPFG